MIPREQVLTYLQGKHESCGGYTGNDITELAEFLNVTSQGLNRRLAYWIQNDKGFSSLVYLGKEKPSITLSEFLEIEYKFVENPIQVKKGIYDEIQTKKDIENLAPLSKSTYIGKLTKHFSHNILMKRNTAGLNPRKSPYHQIIPLKKTVMLYQHYSFFQT